MRRPQRKMESGKRACASPKIIIAMPKRLVLIVLAAVFAVGTGIVVQLVTGEGTTAPQIPKAKRSPPLEEAKAEGIIFGYRVVPGLWGTYGYEVLRGEVSLKFPNACGDRSCPYSTPVIQIEYQRAAGSEAREILRLTRAWAKRTFKSFSLNFFEVTE